MKSPRPVACCAAFLLASINPAHAADPSDTRQAVVLTPREYSWLLGEMRGHLEAIGSAQRALSEGDLKAAQQALLDRGTAHLKTPGRLNLAQKTTEAWKVMAGGMHQSFDAAANGVANNESAQQVMGRIGQLMQACAACHGTYRLVEAP